MGEQNAKASEVLIVLSKPWWASEGPTAKREVPMLPALGLDSGKTNTLSQGHSVLSQPTWASLLTFPGIPLNTPRQPNFLSTVSYISQGLAFGTLSFQAAPWRVYNQPHPPLLVYLSRCYCAHPYPPPSPYTHMLLFSRPVAVTRANVSGPGAPPYSLLQEPSG